MIIEATQTFSPGNVELLQYLLVKIREYDMQATVYLGHGYTCEKLSFLNSNRIRIVKSSQFKTFLRFCQRRSNVLFFCSYPPFLKSEKSIVYFHTQFFLWPRRIFTDESLSLQTKLKRILLNVYISVFKYKVDHFFCQTDLMAKDLMANFKGINVDVVPFYNDAELTKASKEAEENKLFDFFYPSTPDIHKNHFRLFEAIRIVGAERRVKLCVTIDENATKYISALENINSQLGYDAIVNVGRVPKKDIINFYQKSKCVVFPSLKESLGLPLIEASSLGCLVIGSNLEYLYNVIDNPVVFDLLNIQFIASKLRNFLDGAYSNVVQTNLVKNKISDIIDFFL